MGDFLKRSQLKPGIVSKLALAVVLLAGAVPLPVNGAEVETGAGFVVQIPDAAVVPKGGEVAFDGWVKFDDLDDLEAAIGRFGGRDVSPLRRVRVDRPTRIEAPADNAFAVPLTPNDPFYPLQWHFPLVNIDDAWSVSSGVDVTVAVVDTGILPGPDLACAQITTGYNAFSDTWGPTVALDDNGHGTHMAGTIAQCTNNGIGVAGVAFDAALMPVKVLDSAGEGTDFSIARGIEAARVAGVDVINLSLGISPCLGDWVDQPDCVSPIITAAVDKALADGISVVAAAGNDSGFVNHPANHPGVIAVGGVGDDGLRGGYSSVGGDLDVMAPGGNAGNGVVQESFDNLGFGLFSAQGTSSAAAHVSGVMAMLRSVYPHVPFANLKAAVEQTSVDGGSPGFDTNYGHGVIDALAVWDFPLGAVERWWGPNRYATAAAVSQANFPGGSGIAYLVSGEVFADALGAGVAAGRAGGPLLLTTGDSLPGETAEELARLGLSDLVVVGGPNAVSDEVMAQATSAAGVTARRVSSDNRYSTAAALAQDSGVNNGGALFIASGEAFADGVAIGPAAISADSPLLLTQPSVLPEATATAIASADPGVVYILGGPLAISGDVATEIQTMVDAPVVRLGGQSRFDTAKVISDVLFQPDPSQVGIVSGLSFPDALTLGAVLDGPILLSTAETLPGPSVTALERLQPEAILVAGGPLAVSDEILLKLADLVAPGPSATRFAEVAIGVGLDHSQQVFPPDDCMNAQCDAEYMTGGAAAGDVDGDGDVDLFVTRFDLADKLYCNQLADSGVAVFADCSAEAGFNGANRTNGAAFGDIDNDGDLDLAVGTVGEEELLLYVNNGAGVFTNDASARGVASNTDAKHSAFGVAFGDVDRDGYLDLYVAQWRSAPLEGSEHYSALFLNQGSTFPGYFDDVTVSAGLKIENTVPCQCEFGFGPLFSDLDNDGWLDLAISSDFGTSRLFWNDGDTTFTDGTAAAGVGTDENGMGNTIGDFDRDGDLDWFVTSIYDTPPFEGTWGVTGNRLYANQGGRVFTDATDAAGVRNGYWGWGAAFFDYDHDGWEDLVMTNGVDFPAAVVINYKTDPTRLWSGGSAPMNEIADQVGMTDTSTGKGLLIFDYDGDGDSDVFIAATGTAPRLFRNDGGNRSHWLGVRVQGSSSNRDGLGARVSITEDGITQTIEIGSQTGFLATSEYVARFGLGDSSDPIDVLNVTWLGGASTTLLDVPVDQVMTVVEP